MKKILMTIGLPGSGKSTWAKEYIAKNPSTVRVNKDDLRAMLHNGIHSKGRENFVRAVRDFIVGKALADGHDVIVDDTNFNPVHKTRMEELAAEHGAVVEIKDFTDVPLDVCITRDLQRTNPVGEKVIRTIYNQYLRPKPPVITPDPNLPDAVLCDIDGTLALFGKANPYERDFCRDELNKPVRDMLYQYKDQNKIILVSGRMDKFRETTEDWLACNGVPYDHFFMRKTDDLRKDYIIKEEIYNEQIKGKFNVVAVIDDRLQVCRLWYRLGLPLFKVGDPDADY